MRSTSPLDLFNQAFRKGANARDWEGHAFSGERPAQAETPPPPCAGAGEAESNAWSMGYDLGYRMGASDRELASVPEPGAAGMISSLSAEMLGLLGIDIVEPDSEA